VSLSSSVIPSALVDTGGDTKIQVEKNPDEDFIRFDLEGKERMLLVSNTASSTRLDFNDERYNTAIGRFALFANQSGYVNTAVGTSVLFSNLSGSSNTALGGEALYQNLYGDFNTSIGASSMYSNERGNSNTASGSFSLYFNKTGSGNTANGLDALRNNVGGNWNTAIGQLSLQNNTIGGRQHRTRKRCRSQCGFSFECYRVG
jgi:hypothetical protein